MFRLHNDGVLHSNWLQSIQNVLNELGNCLIHGYRIMCILTHVLTNSVKRCFKDQFVQNWQSKINE